MAARTKGIAVIPPRASPPSRGNIKNQPETRKKRQ